MSIQRLAQAVVRGEISFDGVVDPDVLLAPLREIPGIGEWTAQYVAMRALGEPDAFPTGDIALLRKLGLRDSRQLEERAEAWRPWRAYAAIYLWSMSGEPRVETDKKKSAGGEADEVSVVATRQSRARTNNVPKDLQFAD
jgi:AraC family transcriptional regulator of adaptative response / DNA-3-methyladenine glycosylase II